MISSVFGRLSDERVIAFLDESRSSLDRHVLTSKRYLQATRRHLDAIRASEDTQEAFLQIESIKHGISMGTEALLQASTDIMNDLLLVNSSPVDDVEEAQGEDHFSPLSENLICQICTYLPLHDMSRVRRSCKALHSATNPMNCPGQTVWKCTWAEWKIAMPRRHPIHIEYLLKRIQHTRWEISHWTSTLSLMQAVKKVERGFIIDISGNIGRFPSIEIAQAVTKKRPQALVGVIVTDITVAFRFRSASPGYRGPVSFMIANTPLNLAVPRPAINAPGFVGYALDLLELRPHEESLRDTVLSCYVYRDLTVWKTEDDMRRAWEAGLYPVLSPFACFLLDETMEPISLASTVTAPWGQYRPRLRDIVSPQKYLDNLSARLVELQDAVSPMMV